MQSATDILTSISNCNFNHNELIPDDMSDGIYILKQHMTDQEGMQNDSLCSKSS